MQSAQQIQLIFQQNAHNRGNNQSNEKENHLFIMISNSCVGPKNTCGMSLFIC